MGTYSFQNFGPATYTTSITVVNGVLIDGSGPYAFYVMEKYKPRDDGDGSAGVAAMVPVGPSQGSGGLYVDVAP